MRRFIFFIRRPVKRLGAEQYILYTLVSFAISVTLTRLFLELTGYPQLGGGDLHIAHVLWGGLLLFAAALLPLIIANRWVYILSSVLAGLGVGLFIDEVGKFITQTNDYFTPLAAPIIYATFLLTVLVYLRVRRPPIRDPRAEMYRAFEGMEEVLEHDLEPHERAAMEARLQAIAGDPKSPYHLGRLANDLLAYLAWEKLELAPERVTFWHRILSRWQAFESRWISRLRLKGLLVGGLLGLGVMALSNMALAFPLGAGILTRLLERLLAEGALTSSSGLPWFLARMSLEAITGTMLLASAGLLIAGRDRLGVLAGTTSLLVSLTIVNLLAFYFDQFSAITTATVQLYFLLIAGYYRRRFLPPVSEPPGPATLAGAPSDAGPGGG
jgi:hypothetical protein